MRVTVAGLGWLFAAAMPLSAQGGKVEGRVQDSSGAMLAYVQVTVAGTAFSALTSSRGYYFINNIPAGPISLTAAFIGYKAVEVQGLTILAGQTTTQDFILETSPVLLEAITVVAAYNALVPRDEVTTKQRVSGEFADNLPVDRLESILALQPGVVGQPGGGITIRGGRPDEAAIYVDGVPISPGYRMGQGFVSPASTVLDVGTNAFAEASVTTGAYSAEFGNAQSGVIAVQTRSGGAHYTGSVGFETDEPFGVNHGIGFNRIQGSFGGPLPLFDRLRFYLSAVLEGRRSEESGFDRALAPRFVPAGTDTIVTVPSVRGDPNADTTYVTIQKLAVFTGNCDEFAGSTNRGMADNYGLDCQGIRISGTASSAYQLLGKLSYTFGHSSRVSLSTLASQDQGRNFSDEIFVSQQTFGTRSWNRVYTLNWMQNLSRSAERALAIDASLSYQQDRVISSPLSQDDETGSRNPFGGFMLRPFEFRFNFDNFPVNDALVQNFRRNTGVRSPYDLDHPDQYALIDRYRNSPYGLAGFAEGGGPTGLLQLFKENRLTGRANLDWQIDRHNRFKLGGEFTNYSLTSYGHDLSFSGGADVFIAKPSQRAAFVENRLDLGDAVLVGGLRYDWYDSHGSLPYYRDSTSGKYVYFPRVLSNPDFDPSNPGSIFRPNKSHGYLSPHIQVSFPVTTTTNFRFSYAHQVQQPDFALILRRSNNDLQLSSGVYGSDLDFARTIGFEMGVRHAFSEDMVLDIAAYNKDNLANATGRTFTLHDPLTGGTADVSRLTTADYGNVRGIDVRLDRRIGRLFNSMISYTYESAKNTGDDPFSYFNRASLILQSISGSNVQPPQSAFTTRGSRPHNLSALMALSLPSDWRPGTLAGSILDGVGVFATMRFASGNAYTRCPNVTGNEGVTSDGGACSYALSLGTFNGARLPPFKQFDLRVTKSFSLGRLDVTGYLDARNVFNFKNILVVYSALNDTRSDAEHAKTWSADSGNFAAEGNAAGVLDDLGRIDLTFGGAGTAGCGNWVTQGDTPAAPNCVYLIRAEERYGNGDHIFTVAEQRRASDAAYLEGRGLHVFTGTPRRLRVGVEISF